MQLLRRADSLYRGVAGHDIAGRDKRTALEIDVSDVRFIEEDRVPRDAEVVDHTWRYVNKSGGPDRRFKDNPRLPIVLYQEILFQSPSGLNELIQLSRTGVGDPVRDALAGLAELAGGS